MSSQPPPPPKKPAYDINLAKLLKGADTDDVMVDLPDREEQETEAYYDDDEDEGEGEVMDVDDDDDDDVSVDGPDSAFSEEDGAKMVTLETAGAAKGRKILGVLYKKYLLEKRRDKRRKKAPVQRKKAARKRKPVPVRKPVVDEDGDDSMGDDAEEERRVDEEDLDEGSGPADFADDADEGDPAFGKACKKDSPIDEEDEKLYAQKGMGEYDKSDPFIAPDDEDGDAIMIDDEDEEDEEEAVPSGQAVVPSPVSHKPAQRKKARPPSSARPRKKAQEVRYIKIGNPRSRVSVDGKFVVSAPQEPKQDSITVHSNLSRVVRTGEPLPSYSTLYYNTISWENTYVILVHDPDTKCQDFPLLVAMNSNKRLVAFDPDSAIFKRLQCRPFPTSKLSEAVPGFNLVDRDNMKVLHSFYYGKNTRQFGGGVAYSVGGRKVTLNFPMDQEYLQKYASWYANMKSDPNYQRNITNKCPKKRRRRKTKKKKKSAAAKEAPEQPVATPVAPSDGVIVVEESSPKRGQAAPPPPKKRRLNSGMSDRQRARQRILFAQFHHMLLNGKEKHGMTLVPPEVGMPTDDRDICELLDIAAFKMSRIMNDKD